MDAPPSIPTADRPSSALRRFFVVAALAGVVFWHARTTLAAFGDPAWDRLTNAEPIVSGRHPTHFYHAAVAAESLSSAWSCSCYDPFHAAGYAHTDGVDFDARPYIPFLFGANQEWMAARYKWALALLWISIPMWFWAAGRVARCSSVGAIIAAAMSVALANAALGKTLFEEGDLGQALGAVLAILHLSFLVRCHSHPTCKSFAGLLLTAGIGWCLQPLIWSGAWLLSFGCWLGVFRRHSLRWHGAFGLAQGIAVAIALPWLAEWVRHWWLTVPIRSESVALRPIGISDWPSWANDNLDRMVGVGLVACGFVGGLLRRSGLRPRPMKCLVWSSIIVSACAVASARIDILAPFSAPGYLFLGLGLAIIPAAHGLCRLRRWIWIGSMRRWIFGLTAAVVSLVLFGQLPSATIACWGLTPLQVGLPPDLRAAIGAVKDQTTSTGRILWEEPCGSRTSHATTFLPLWTGRQFLGGESELENGYPVLHDAQLCGRPIAHWTDAELEAFCRRYNVGWLMVAVPATMERLGRWPAAHLCSDLNGWRLYALKRPLSFALKGAMRTFDADRNRITMTDVVPEQGDVVISMHFHESLRVRPGWIQIEREPDAHDPVPLVRLKMVAPAARVTLTWEPR